MEASHIATVPAAIAVMSCRRDAWNGKKTRVSIDDLLVWAYRIELPKARRAADPVLAAPTLAGSGGGMMAMLIELGTRVQVSLGSAPGFAIADAGEPLDPDALRIAAAVSRLDELVVDLDGVDLIDEPAFEGLTEAERAAAHEAGRTLAIGEDGRLRSSLAAFVVTGAVIGRERPVREAEPVRRDPVVGANGKPIWFLKVQRSAGDGRPAHAVETVDGLDTRTRRPHPQAYRKFRLDPDPAPIVRERIEYQAWRFGLDVLCQDLAPVLERFEPAASSAPWWPWRRGAAGDGGPIS